ncbi:MAG TPA: glucosyl-3-phosphoglycerate synthase [Acidimicrobiales bacterium]|jgi:glucosyl-3-phosphoglycerate synthase|nr:glucosyl-3-phosphoglycerate synthase [Acidimicrobiales bacterium]
MAQQRSGDDQMPAEPSLQPSTPGHRCYPHSRFDAATLAEVKGTRRISVCIPARNEAATVGSIVATIVNTLTGVAGGVPLVDEVLVVDDGSIDGTGELARQAGARVVPAERGIEGPTPGSKGQAMRTALEVTDGDLVAFVDADVTNFGPHFVTGLLGPLLVDDSTSLVKGYYQRPLHGAPGGGGRVTELVAKPIIDLLFPDLTGILQPLAGETAAPRSVLEKCGLADGYQVELALLIDVAVDFGADTIAQVDLGVRAHRNRPLSELRPQATDILRTALARADLTRGL